MTIALFRDDASLLSCTATLVAVVPAAEPGAGACVRLDRSVFYPQGGGQAGDRGVLRLADGREIPVVDTRKGPEGAEDILHRVPDGVDLPASLVGQAVTAHIDAERRDRHRRLHTATHLLCALVPYPVDGCSITAEYARLDFHTAQALDKAELNAGLARLVAEARPVTSRWITDAELDAAPQLVRSMSVQPPRGSGRVRLIEIEGVDLQPCGGTHVTNTAEIGAVCVAKIEKKGAQTRRVVLQWATSAAA